MNYPFVGSSENCRTYVRFNGVPLIETEPHLPVSTSENLFRWALPGTSRLEVSLSKVPTTPPDEVSFKAKLYEVSRGVDPATTSPLWELTWPPPSLGDVVPFYRVFEIPTQTASELWNRAEPLHLDEETRQSAMDYVKHLHSIFSSGDHARLADEMKFRAEDLGLIEGTTKQDSIEDQRRFFKMIMEPSESSFEARPLAIGKNDLRVMADHKVLRVTSGDAPALLSQEGQGMELFLSKVESRWVCSR